MLDLWKAYRGRRAAAAAIIPFVDGTRRRLGGIPDSAWHDPYVVGFLGMLITVITTRLLGSLSTDALAAVQAGAWTDITGMPGDIVGEEILFLGTSRDNRFIVGCGNAETFFRALDAASRRTEQNLGAGADALPASESVEDKPGSSLWSRYFDAYLVGPLPDVET